MKIVGLVMVTISLFMILLKAVTGGSQDSSTYLPFVVYGIAGMLVRGLAKPGEPTSRSERGASIAGRWSLLLALMAWITMLVVPRLLVTAQVPGGDTWIGISMIAGFAIALAACSLGQNVPTFYGRFGLMVALASFLVPIVLPFMPAFIR